MRYTILALAALTAAVQPAAAQPANAAECTRLSAAAVEGQFSRFTTALATRNPDAMVGLFAPDAVLLPTLSNTPRTTPAAVRDYFVHFLAKSPSVHVDTTTIHSDCHSAERVGTWTWTLTDPATHHSSQVRGRYSFIYRLDGDQWRIDHLHSSLMPEAETRTAHR